MDILIAEDNVTSRRLLRRILEKIPGTRVTEAEDGEVAWALLEKGGAPALCIFDIMMPRMDGFELVRRLRADQRLREVPVIFCSALNDRGTLARAAELSVRFFITKPYSVEVLVSQVRKVQASRERPHAGAAAGGGPGALPPKGLPDFPLKPGAEASETL